MTKNSFIFVILIIILVTLGIFVIYDIHDNLSSVIFQVNHDKTTMTKIYATMTKKDGNFSTMTEMGDKKSFVTFNYLPRGDYIFIVTMSDNEKCEFEITLDRRIKTYKVDYQPNRSNPCHLS